MRSLTEAVQEAVCGMSDAVHAQGPNAAILAEPDCPTDAVCMARAIVTDIPGEQIRVSLYAEDGRAAAVELNPLRALCVAGELIAAAHRRLR